MKKFKNIILIGTSHIAKESVNEVRNTILEVKPAVVALELDRNRLFAMLNKGNPNLKKKFSFKDVRAVGFKGYVFSIIGEYFEKKLGSKVNVSPGDEMLAGFHAAKEVQSKIALVDQDISITLRRFSEKLTWKEKFRFVKDIFASLFFARRQVKKMGLSENISLEKVPSEKVIKKLVKYLKDNYPNVHLVLVEERNKFIAANLHKLAAFHKDDQIIAVLGAGHIDDVLELLKEFDDGKKVAV